MKWQKDQDICTAEHHTTYTPQTVTKCRGIKWAGRVAGITAEKCIKNLDHEHWKKMSHWQAAHEWEGNNKMDQKTYSGKGDPLLIRVITGTAGGLNTISHWTFQFHNKWEMFMTGTENIHCSKRILLLDVKLKMWNAMPTQEKKFTCLKFSVLWLTLLHGKMVPVQF
jgi:hypothetical protein